MDKFRLAHKASVHAKKALSKQKSRSRAGSKKRSTSKKAARHTKQLPDKYTYVYLSGRDAKNVQREVTVRVQDLSKLDFAAHLPDSHWKELHVLKLGKINKGSPLDSIWKMLRKNKNKLPDSLYLDLSSKHCAHFNNKLSQHNIAYQMSNFGIACFILGESDMRASLVTESTPTLQQYFMKKR